MVSGIHALFRWYVNKGEELLQPKRGQGAVEHKGIVCLFLYSLVRPPIHQSVHLSIQDLGPRDQDLGLNG